LALPIATLYPAPATTVHRRGKTAIIVFRPN
jgi:hypothetical protein